MSPQLRLLQIRLCLQVAHIFESLQRTSRVMGCEHQMEFEVQAQDDTLLSIVREKVSLRGNCFVARALPVFADKALLGSWSLSRIDGTVRQHQRTVVDREEIPNGPQLSIAKQLLFCIGLLEVCLLHVLYNVDTVVVSCSGLVSTLLL